MKGFLLESCPPLLHFAALQCRLNMVRFLTLTRPEPRQLTIHGRELPGRGFLPPSPQYQLREVLFYPGRAAKLTGARDIVRKAFHACTVRHCSCETPSNIGL